jgi:hypothetical protein
MRFSRIASSLFILFTFFSLAAEAQNANIRGFVYFKESGEPALFTTVYLQGTTKGVSTNVDGYFSITQVSPGTYTLAVAYLGYDTIRESITVKGNEIITRKLFLTKSAAIDLGVVEIEGDQTEKTLDTRVSEVTITPKDINQIPSVGGEPDIAQYLQVLPGVIFTGDQGGQLYIRGGSPIQNKVLLDGMIIYNPFHSIGLFSVFDADIIRNADVYTGGFGAEYGGRISSIMDITTRDGNKKKIGGKVSVSPFLAKTLIEGPLRKQTSGSTPEEVKKEIDRENQDVIDMRGHYTRLDSTNKQITQQKKGVTDSKELIRMQKQIDSNRVAMAGLRSKIDDRNKSIEKLNKEYNRVQAGSLGTSSFIFSAKHSYLPQTSKVVYSYVDTAGLPFGFTDLYGKVSFNSANGSKFNLFGFNFRDHVNYKALADFGWNSFGVGSNFLLVPASSSILVDGVFAYSKYEIGMQEELQLPDSSSIGGFNMGLNFTYFRGLNELKYGIEVLGFRTDFTFYNSVDRKISQEENTTELGGYFKYKIVTQNRKWLIEPSFRAHYYASLQNFSPEPRFSMKFNATDNLRFKMASGIYSQNLLSATSDRDVVNLFYGFLSGPDNLPSQFTTESGEVRDITSKLQKANHIVIGLEYDPFRSIEGNTKFKNVLKHLEFNLEVYRKNFTQLTNINRNKLYEDDGTNFDKPDMLKKDFIIETGKAQGVDLLLKYDYKNLYVWAVYSLGFVDRWDGVQSYNPHFDRRHNVNLVAAWEFGKDKEWELNGRWNLGSGFPFTKTRGFYEYQTFIDGINSDYLSSNNNPDAQLGILYGDLNTGRLPYYHRLDITLKREFRLSETSIIEATLGATNVYNRENIFYFDRVQYERVNQLPIMPSLSASWTF